MNLPAYEGLGFDPVGDLNELEALLFERPTIEISETPNEVEEVILEDEKPVKNQHGGSPPKSTKSRDKARNNLDQLTLRLKKWYLLNHMAKLKCRNNHSPHYMHSIRFGPGNFKFWWVDPFKFSKYFLNSTFIYLRRFWRTKNNILINNDRQMEFNGLDRGWIKYKPPDF